MLLASLSIVFGLMLLIWSADLFVDGSASSARHFGMPPLLIGMLIVGFGTSAPEMVVSAFAALQGNPGIALGNAYGSNITNIGLILGMTALLNPIFVHSQVIRKELPILLGMTAVAAWQCWDGTLTRLEGFILLFLFAGLMGWTLMQGGRQKSDPLGSEMESTLGKGVPLAKALTKLVIGLVLLIASSRLLVWGAVHVANDLGVSDLIIGLTIVAIGTSLPELASSLLATRKGEHDIALGNVLGSNLFNTLAVVGIAGSIHPMQVGPEVLTRDILTMLVFTVSLFAFGYGFRGQGRVNRVEGSILLAGYFVYTGYLTAKVF